MMMDERGMFTGIPEVMAMESIVSSHVAFVFREGPACKSARPVCQLRGMNAYES